MPNAVRTGHPHIVRLEGVCGGEPVIDGLRVTVRHVATLHLHGETIPEIAEALGLTEAQVFHALNRLCDRLEHPSPVHDPDEVAARNRRANTVIVQVLRNESLGVR